DEKAPAKGACLINGRCMVPAHKTLGKLGRGSLSLTWIRKFSNKSILKFAIFSDFLLDLLHLFGPRATFPLLRGKVSDCGLSRAFIGVITLNKDIEQLGIPRSAVHMQIGSIGLLSDERYELIQVQRRHQLQNKC